MVNHIRTLLLNQARGGFDARTPGEVYVPADFKPVVLDAPLQQVHNLLFGPAADRHMRNLRLWQFLPAIHTSDLHELAVKDDPRISYWPFPPELVFEPYFGPHVITGDPDNISFTGDQSIAGGRIFFRWEILVDSGSSVTLTDLQTGEVTAASYTVTNSRSSEISLPGTDMRFTFLGAAGSRWIVEFLGRPQRAAAQVLADLKAGLSESVLHYLWGRETTEPWVSLKALWTREDFAMPAGALLLATAWRTDELRKQQYG